ncbi:hypothetical protein CDAR_619111 [Caerostris darwini]|uniref:Uncharacterized protein n=1 Tax=Caerostris darwini TaxID=1538125 RepID=A0AAV4U2P2_9ARAC|nr:hypothetical protein CDAR_619111 [Caerostris darwini]
MLPLLTGNESQQIYPSMQNERHLRSPPTQTISIPLRTEITHIYLDENHPTEHIPLDVNFLPRAHSTLIMRISNLRECSISPCYTGRGGIVETDQSGLLIGFDWQPDEGLMLARKQLLTERCQVLGGGGVGGILATKFATA